MIVFFGPAGAGKSTLAKKIAANYKMTYLDTGALGPRHLARQLQGIVFKDDPEDARKLAAYIDVAARDRARDSALWKEFYQAASAGLARNGGK